MGGLFNSRFLVSRKFVGNFVRSEQERLRTVFTHTTSERSVKLTELKGGDETAAERAARLSLQQRHNQIRNKAIECHR
jgi:hypothetical protein